MTYEESKVMWQLERMSFDESTKNGNTNKNMAHLYDLVEDLIVNEKLLYSEFCNDMAEEFKKAGDGEPEEVVNTVVLNLTDKYERIS